MKKNFNLSLKFAFVFTVTLFFCSFLFLSLYKSFYINYKNSSTINIFINNQINKKTKISKKLNSIIFIEVEDCLNEFRIKNSNTHNIKFIIEDKLNLYKDEIVKDCINYKMNYYFKSNIRLYNILQKLFADNNINFERKESIDLNYILN